MPETITQLEEQGHTHISCVCDPCRRTVWVAFDTIRKHHRSIDLNKMTIGDLGRRMRCGECGQEPISCSPTAQKFMPGHGRMS